MTITEGSDKNGFDRDGIDTYDEYLVTDPDESESMSRIMGDQNDEYAEKKELDFAGNCVADVHESESEK
jgi:hypothetical protein